MTAPVAVQWGRKPRRPPSAAQVLENARAGAPRARLLEPGHTPPLRLNSDAGRRYGPEELAALGDTNAKLEALRREIARDLDMFARNQHRFLDACFAFAVDRVAVEAARVEAELAWSAGFFEAADRAFSALAPLPNAVIAPAAGDGPATPCDFAFWTGDELLAVVIQGATAGASRLPEIAAPVRFVPIPAAALADPPALFASDRFPAAFRDFWQGDPIPSSPYRPAGLALP